MPTSATNESFDGSPVQFRLDSPFLVFFDPIALDMIREELALSPGDALPDVRRFVRQMNVDYPALACYEIPDFRPGLYTVDPHDIRKFGDDEQDLDFDATDQEPGQSADGATSFPFVAVDSAALILADFSQLRRIVDVLTW